jgi:hypothetical protein
VIRRRDDAASRDVRAGPRAQARAQPTAELETENDLDIDAILMVG